MQFKIPQNVQIEDKIVGPLTFKQLITLGIGSGFAYVLYITLAPAYYFEIWLPPVGLVVLFTLAFTFVKPLGVSFIHYSFLLIEFWIKPRKRIWSKGSGDVFISSLTNISGKKNKTTKKANKKRKTDKLRINDLDKITSILDHHGQITPKHN